MCHGERHTRNTLRHLKQSHCCIKQTLTSPSNPSLLHTKKKPSKSRCNRTGVTGEQNGMVGEGVTSGFSKSFYPQKDGWILIQVSAS